MGRTAHIDDDDEDAGVSLRDCTIIHETEKALRVNFGERIEWVPKSAVHDDSAIWKNGERGVLTVKTWLAEKMRLV